MPRRRATAASAAITAGTALLALATSGCAIKPPQAWEKGALARPEMTMGGDVLGDRFAQHIYTSKENASGGNGVGGGGCGCN
ncbi:hypothetical protein CDN99_26210 [Roseateles aquatilis]|uniref:DUF4266 domain-containing protein n=2 Tax=Roseateles aquatilis TaxID=431061 RepID=A0A246ITS9_9BURK|nr:hypothetical protein CDN99_26210 [Roseateles aquatilis]